ncbi:MAG: methionine adenosyltransferase [Candidatus Sericytochromatia bacterium]|nr:methionine adenosyltransferase [Candidatus Tanganyikabacteria bacterium]
MGLSEESERPIRVSPLGGPPVEAQALEIVERKGIGHPDTICDGVAEAVAAALTREYRRRCGAVRHFNADKSLLVAGSVEHRFGGGTMLEPMRLVLGDRATRECAGKRIPVEDIARKAAIAWLGRNLPLVRPDHVAIEVALKPASPELAELFATSRDVLPANDTSAAVGYAPLTPVEKLVLALEGHLNGDDFKRRFPETGQDVKIMAIRTGRALDLTVAMPLLERDIPSEAAYFHKKREILAAIREGAAAGWHGPARVGFNTLDAEGTGIGGTYLSLLGTSAEDGDSGQVGRGNRVNGVISLNRPAPAEAAPGKNALSHPGKVYNLLAHRLAAEILGKVPGLREVYVWLCSEIGRPLDRPQVAAVQVRLARGARLADVSEPAAAIVVAALADLPLFVEELAAGEISVY